LNDPEPLRSVGLQRTIAETVIQKILDELPGGRDELQTILCLALVSSGVLLGCSTTARRHAESYWQRGLNLRLNPPGNCKS